MHHYFVFEKLPAFLAQLYPNEQPYILWTVLLLELVLSVYFFYVVVQLYKQVNYNICVQSYYEIVSARFAATFL
jgi:hypothetical protein